MEKQVDKSKKIKKKQFNLISFFEAGESLDKMLFEDILENTIAAYPCNDGLNIPYPIRMCFDIIEEKGLVLLFKLFCFRNLL